MDYKTIFIKIIKIGVVLILFTPLILGPFGLSLSNYPKTAFFRTLTEIIFIFYLLLVFLDHKYLPKISLLVGVISLFAGILILSSLTGVNFHLSFFGELHRVEGVILPIHFLIFFLILISIFQKNKDWFLLFKLTVIISAFSSLAGILQKLKIASFYGLSLSRISGTWTNPDFFAPYIVLNIFLAIFLLFAEKKKNWKIILSLILALNFFTLILSGTRASWAGTAVGLIFLFSFWFFGASNLNQKRRKIILLGILGLTIFLLLIIINQDRLSLNKISLFQRIMSLFDLRSYIHRLSVWEIAINAWKDRPILGWGPETFGYLFDKYFKASYIPVLSETLYFDRPHNKVLELMATTGVLGILSYLSIFFTTFYLLLKSKKSLLNLILISLFLSHFVQNLAVFDTIGTYLVLFLVLGFINNNFSPPTFFQKSGGKPPDAPKKSLKFLLIPPLIFLSLIAFYQLNFKPTKASLAFFRGVESEKKDFRKALLEYEEGISQKTIYDKEFKKELIGRLIFILENLKVSKEAEEAVIKVLSGLKPFIEKELEKPDKRYLEFYELLARINERIYLFSGDLEALQKMEEVSKRAISFNDQKPQFYRLIGRAKIFQKNYSEGEAFFQKAFALNPGGFPGKIQFYKVLGVAYLKAGDKLKAAENFKIALEREFSLRKFDEPTSEGVKQTLSFSVGLAQIYYKDLNDAETARQIYQRAMEVFPAYKDQLQSEMEKLIE